jgi:serine/threonine-protein kinase HipA
LASRGLSPDTLNPAVRLSYIGNRGMGALEFKPAEHSKLLNQSVEISLSEMSNLCENILRQKESLDVTLSDSNHANREAMNDIIRIGSSAGGAKPKAIIAMNAAGRILSGHIDAPAGYDHWLIKFDIEGDFDRERNNGIPPASGRIEYAYYKMAKEAKIDMMECRLLEIDGKGHFLTKRFDRVGNEKLHVQTFSALEHLDRDLTHDYSQLIQTTRKLSLEKKASYDIFRRMVFNVLAFNHDDHAKNHAFLMDKTGKWSLTPAFDVTYAYDPSGKWTKRHQMSVFGKQDDITLADMLALAQNNDIPARTAVAIIGDVKQAISRWPEFAKEASLDKRSTDIIQQLLQPSLDKELTTTSKDINKSKKGINS